MDRLAGLVSRGAAKRAAAATTPDPEGILVDRPADPAALLSRPKRAILSAAAELLGMIGAADVPWAMRPLVGMLSGAHPMLVSSVAGMEEEEVRRILTLIRDRCADALAPEPAVIEAAADGRE